MNENMKNGGELRMMENEEWRSKKIGGELRMEENEH